MGILHFSFILKMGGHTVLTNSNGSPVADNQNSLTAGRDGPILLQDVDYIDKIAHFDRERIPERVVHAKGAGAHGYFEVTKDITDICKAKFLSRVGKRTPTFVRFSTVGGERGSSDTARDPRGFAIKFYTEEGNWDMVGNNTPVFFIRDPQKFPDFIHTQKRNPRTNLKDATMFWDFLSQTPESSHQVTYLFGDRGIPLSYRFMNGYSSHTFVMVNDKNRAFYVKFHFKTQQGVKNLLADSAAKIDAGNPDSATEDLFKAIENKKYPAWTAYVQVMPVEDAEKYRIDVLDVTKVWPHADYPLREFGKLVLNRNPMNYHAEVEQSAFCPSNLVPGIEPSADKMLQGRLFSYADTHRYRLGANYTQIPINCPYAARVAHHQRDGAMAINGNFGAQPNYEPNTVAQNPPRESKDKMHYKFNVTGQMTRERRGHKSDDYEQAGNLYRLMSKDARERLVQNIAGHLKNARKDIQLKQVEIFYKCDKEYGMGIAKLLGMKMTNEKSKL